MPDSLGELCGFTLVGVPRVHIGVGNFRLHRHIVIGLALDHDVVVISGGLDAVVLLLLLVGSGALN